MRESEPISPTRFISVAIMGMVAGNLVGAAVCGFVLWLSAHYPHNSSSIVAPSLALTPALIGMVAAWGWRPLRLRLDTTILFTILTMLLAVVVAVLIFQEGSVCLIILSPLLYISLLGGALVGRTWFNDSSKVNSFAAPVLALAIIAEPSLRSPHSSVVTDEILIAAPPAKVWPHVLKFDTIPAAPDFWLFSVGLPYPTRTTNGGNYVGADRACEFSGGAVFKEKIARIEPERLLTFDIIEQPPDPELIGHLDSSRGEFELRDNGDGTTTLIGRTWYSLHVRPAFYFDWWTEKIFSAVHLRVMNNVKRLAESER